MSYASGNIPIADDALTESVLLRRAGAWVIDFVLIGIIVAVLWVVLATFGLLTLGLGFPLLGLLPIVPLAYHVLFIASAGGATPGQAMLDITVRRDLDLGPASLLQALLFTGGLWLTLSAGVVWLAAALFVPRKRALHDLVSGLVVMRRRALTQASSFENIGWGPDRI